MAANPFRSIGQVATVPQEVPATSLKRAEFLDKGIEIDRKVQTAALQTLPGATLNVRPSAGNVPGAAAGLGDATPLTDAVRDKALAFVNDQLIAATPGRPAFRPPASS